MNDIATFELEEDECVACGKTKLCTLQGELCYPLCLTCYEQAVADQEEP